MDLSLPAMSSANVPSADEMRFTLLARAAKLAVSYQHHDNPHHALRVAVRPSGWRQVLQLRRSRSMKVWLMMDTPFDGLCLGEDRMFYMLKDDEPTLTVTFFEVSACTPHEVARITEVLFDMAAPARW